MSGKVTLPLGKGTGARSVRRSQGLSGRLSPAPEGWGRAGKFTDYRFCKAPFILPKEAVDRSCPSPRAARGRVALCPGRRPASSGGAGAFVRPKGASVRAFRGRPPSAARSEGAEILPPGKGRAPEASAVRIAAPQGMDRAGQRPETRQNWRVKFFVAVLQLKKNCTYRMALGVCPRK